MKLTFVEDIDYGDWIAVYKDGELIYQDHRISGKELSELLGLDIEFRTERASLNEDTFPQKLEDIKSD